MSRKWLFSLCFHTQKSMCFPLYFASMFLFYYYVFSHFVLDEVDHLRIRGSEKAAATQHVGLLAITISNENLFNYKVVDLVATYNFHIYFFFLHLRSFENFEFGCQNNLNWKFFNYKVVDRLETYNLCINYFLIWDNLSFSKIKCSNIIKSHKGDTP